MPVDDDWNLGHAILVLLAGPEAERRITGEALSEIWEGRGLHDISQAVHLVGEDGVRRTQEIAERLVTILWPLIQTVATALLQSAGHTLTGDDIERLLRRPETRGEH